MDFYHHMHLNPNVEDCVEHPSSHSIMETTGYEKIEKTVNRLMLAGLNLYQVNRNADFQGSDPEGVDKDKPYMSKWSDVKDVTMRMREIQRRLRNKMKNPVPDEGDYPGGGEPVTAAVDSGAPGAP